MTLRKKAPFWCRHQINGKMDCTATPLSDADKRLCPKHQAEADAAHERFLHAPIRAAAKHEDVPVGCRHVVELYPTWQFCGGKIKGKERCELHLARLPFWP